MKSLEISAKTVDEAVQKALEQLGLTQEEVKITVIKEGKQGLFGLGTEEATVKVTPLTSASESADDKKDIVQSVIETLLSKMGITATVTSNPNPFIEQAPEEPSPLFFEIKGDDLGILIGRRGQALTCLQHIVRLIVASKTKERIPVVIDVEEYKQRHYKSLQELALRIAERVKIKGSPFRLDPMPAFERRIIHMALAENPDVTTESTGEGESRRVVIMPRK